jgi:aryl-alcohol dehydrogenase-like predicted oxidoreductase
VRYIGSSVFPPSAIVQAQWAARDSNLQRYVCEQPPYSMLARGIEADVLSTCQRYGMGVISWSSLSGGWLSGKWRKNADDLEPMSEARKRLADRYDLSMPVNQRKLDAADQLAQLAEEAGISLIEMAIAFVINHPAVTAAIIGPRTMEQLESQLPPLRSRSPTMCSTASMRSSLPARTSSPARTTGAAPPRTAS